jgi:hypothetical protein
MAITRFPRRPGARRAATIALAVGLVAGLAAASYALVAPKPAARVAAANKPAAMLTIRARSPTRTATRGGSAVYGVSIGGYGRHVRRSARSARLALRVWLSAVKPLPRGVTAAFAPRATRSSGSTLTLRVKPSARLGTYRVRLQARGHLGPPGHRPMRRARTTVRLVIASAQTRAFTIAGQLTELLAPGRAVPLDLALINSKARPLRITGLAVSIVGIRAPAADTSHPCSTADFAVVQFTGSYRLHLGARSTRRLSAFGVAPGRWPRVAMVNRPFNQDGCKRASVALRFTGRAVLG